MIVKQPVSRTLARAFFAIIALSLLTSAIALFTLASSQRDAEAINLAGSLRMQSYRLGYDMQRGNADLLAHRQAWQHTLNAPALLTLKSWYVPDEVQQRYHLLQLAWQGVDEKLAQGENCGLQR